MSRLTAYIVDQFLAQRGHLFPWSAVMYGGGVGVFFALRYEPDLLLRWIGITGVAALVSAVVSPPGYRPIFWALTLFCAGFVMAEWRSSKVSAPILGFRYYGAVEGRIIAIDRSASDAVRLTLDQVVLDDVQVVRLPERVRVSLHGDQQHFQPEPGDVVAMAAHLSPPSGPVEPGGFDFQRHAWFLRLGAVGYTNTPVMVITPADVALPIFRLRVNLSKSIQERIEGNPGAFAAAVMTGDRSAMGQDVLEQLRATNLAHLLAISGLHMGFLAGAVFAAIRGGFALVPSIASRLPAKKIIAVGALMASTLYLALSGGAVATERAFVMIAVALVATLLNRRAISLRAVAVAALIVLTLSPEALLSPGFQMSFAATTALVAVFALQRDAEWTLGPKWLRPAVVLLISSSVAGAATAPYSAAHFNQIAQWGLLANLLSVPVMGTLVIPGAVLASVLAPFGGEALGLWFASLGLRWILWVAEWVSQLDGSIRGVVQPQPVVLIWLSAGALFVVLWKGAGRLLGLLPLVVAAFLWSQTDRPFVLVSDTGGLVGIMTSEGRALSRAKGDGFVAQVWLENDGVLSDQATSSVRWQEMSQFPVRHVRGKQNVADLKCFKGETVVTDREPPVRLSCRLLSPKVFRTTCSVSIDRKGQITTSRDLSGARRWHPWYRDQ